MACSNCSGPDHNIQRCPTVRRCGHCDRAGHDRRNCPRLHPSRPEPSPRRSAPPPVPPANTSPPAWDQIRRLHQLCAGRSDLLAHLYWPDRLPYFERSRDAHVRGGAWRLKATPGHGVGKPDRPTLNFLVASTEWVDAYAIAAERRDLRHGLLVRRAALTKLGPDYTLVDVTPRHPGGHADPRESWRHDVPNHRFAALDAMHRCTVVRLATPLADRARHVDIPAEEIVAWW